MPNLFSHFRLATPLCLLFPLLSGCGSIQGDGGKHPTQPEFFSRDVDGLETALPPQIVELSDGDTLRLTAGPVKKVLAGVETRMLAYNGSVPGPLIRVREGAAITILLHNRAGLPTSLHSHGVRMDWRSDGDPMTAPAVPDGGTGAFSVRFPDPGVYWYHPHVREDYSLELGLYGNYHVIPRDSAYWNRVDREEFLVLDDVLVDGGGIVPFRKDQADHAMMGRFGNVFMVNGDTGFVLEVRRNELIRFYATNACGARVLRLGFKRNVNVKAVGSDNGRYEASLFPGFEYLAPGERYVFESFFPSEGEDTLIHRMPGRDVALGRIKVLPDTAVSGHYRRFVRIDSSASVIADIGSYRSSFGHPPDQELLLTVRMGGHAGHAMPKASASAHEVTGIEWEDHMGEMNSGTTSDEITWIIRDARTGLENGAIHWSFNQGDKVKIRVRNDSAAMHPMPHPIHFHGQRFLVTHIDGIINPALGWKDTFLIGPGQTADILLDAANPGKWMAHCHISEHLEASMMFHFTVAAAEPASGASSAEP